jgi:pyridoxine 4-dehydrogenase
LENLASGDIVLSNEEVQEIHGVVSSHEIKGDRYFGLSDEQMHLWG